tara:strand:+ start:1230 stop:3281 length:2052 start_codon:yes stop_codon:yes gene_type:complete
MADLGILSVNVESGIGSNIPSDASGMLKKCQKNISLSYKKWKKYYKEIEHNRVYALGKLNPRSITMVPSQNMQEGGRSIKGNIIHATLQGLLPHIYAKNPEIRIRPHKYVEAGSSEYRVADLFSATLETVLNESLKKADLKKVAKQVIRSCMTSKVGIVKVTYQRDYYKDPLVSRQFNDAQDSLARLQSDVRELMANNTYGGEKDELIEEVKETMLGLQDRVEVMQREGLNLGFVRPEDFRMDTSLDTLQEYQSAQWMANVTWMTPSDVMDRFQISKKEVEEFTIYRRTDAGILNRLTRDDAVQANSTEDVNLAVAVWEYWDRTAQTVFTFAEGGKKWLKEPFHPNRLGEKFFPFFLLGLNWVDGQEWPISETELLLSLQDEYNTIRTQHSKHRELSAPFFVADASRVNYEDIEVFSNAAIGEIALINASGQNVNTVFQPAVPPPMNPQVYDTAPLRTDMEWISGLGDAQRGGVNRAKTATEANIQQAGLATRIAEKVDQTEDWLKELGWFAAEILLQEIQPQKAMEIAGPQAFWPILNKQQLYDSVFIDIAAGSTGMPDTNEERMRWIELMPIIMQNIELVQQMRSFGVPDEFNPYVQLLEETFARFDERIDISKFLPPMPEEMQKVMQQNQMMQQAMGQGGQQIQTNAVPPPQGLNEVQNAPQNRIDQRTRNQYREPQGEI